MRADERESNLALAQSSPSQWLHLSCDDSLEQGVEGRLLEMFVAGQGIDHTPLAHDDEREAVGQRPDRWRLLATPSIFSGRVPERQSTKVVAKITTSSLRARKLARDSAAQRERRKAINAMHEASLSDEQDARKISRPRSTPATGRSPQCSKDACLT